MQAGQHTSGLQRSYRASSLHMLGLPVPFFLHRVLGDVEHPDEPQRLKQQPARCVIETGILCAAGNSMQLLTDFW